MATIEESIEAALFSYLAALEIDGAPPLAWPTVPFAPPAGTPYIDVTHLPNRNSRIVLKGSGPHWRQGILQLTVVTPLNAGAPQATALAGSIAELFPAGLDLFEDGIRIRIQQAPDVLPGDKTDVSWDVVVSVRWECFA